MLLSPARHFLVLVLLVSLPVGTVPVAANGVTARAVNTWTADGTVQAAVVGDGVVFVGGTFRTFGPRLGSLVAVDRLTNEPLPWPKFDGGDVSNVLRDGGGGYTVFGSFTMVDDVSVTGPVRITAEGRLDPIFRWPLPIQPDRAFIAANRLVVSRVYQSALMDPRSGRVLAGPFPFAVQAAATGPRGELVALTYTATSRHALVRLNVETGAIEHLLHEAPSGVFLSALAVAGEHAYIASWGGSFNPDGQVLEVEVAGGPPRRLADVKGGQAGRGTSPPVAAIVPHDGRLFIQGELTAVNGTPFGGYDPYLALALDAGTGSLTGWRAAAGASGRLLAADGNRLLFDSALGAAATSQVARGLYALDDETGAYTGWSLPVLAELSNAVRGLVVEPHRLIVGGRLAGVGLEHRSGIAAISLPSGRPTSWRAEQGTATLALGIAGTRVFATHDLGRRIVEYDAVTGTRTDWQAAIGGSIIRLQAETGRLFVSGTFTAIDGVARPSLASFDISGDIPRLDSWAPALASAEAAAFLTRGGTVVAAGRFRTTAGAAFRSLLALDARSGAVLPWTPALNGNPPATDIATTGDRIFVAGGFTAVNGQPRAAVAAFDLSGQLLPWQPDLEPGSVWTPRLVLFDDRLYVSTGFPTGGAALDLLTGRRVAWQPESARPHASMLAVPSLGLLRYGIHPLSGPLEGAFGFHQRISDIAPVTGLRALSSGVLQLQWNAAAGAERYIVEAGTAPDLSNLAAFDTRSAATTFISLVAAGRYFIRVRGANEGGVGPVSNEIVVVSGPGACVSPPNRPESLQATVAGQTASLTWQPPATGEPVARYALDLVSGPGAPVTLARTTSPSFAGSAPPGSYAIAVRAENACGTSPPSDTLTVTIGATLR